MNSAIYLGVNVDHIATLRQARGTPYPDPVHAALEAEMAGADGIRMHLREDRRHIQDQDVQRFSECAKTKLNFEIAPTQEMLNLALKFKPKDMCLVPEKREELTTEGGLDVVAEHNRLTEYCSECAQANIQVSLFIDPDEAQIEATARVGAPVVELHTGNYAEATTENAQLHELNRLVRASEFAFSHGLIVNAGHGLHYNNVQAIAAIETIHELNIGHSIIAKAAFIGIKEAVKEMKQLMVDARYR